MAFSRGLLVRETTKWRTLKARQLGDAETKTPAGEAGGSDLYEPDVSRRRILTR